MIEVKSITFGYRGKGRLFRDFSLALPDGHIYGLLGCNGTGKSTMLKLFCGMLAPLSGEVRMNGFKASERRAEMMKDIMIVPEEFELPAVSASEYARFTAPFYPSFSVEQMNGYLERFEVSAEQNFKSMSLGQRKKAYLAFAMACNTPTLLLDEPTNGLDIPSKVVFRRLLAEWAAEGRTAMISTHQVKDVENLIDHIVMIDLGGVVLNASVEQICRRLLFTTSLTAEGAIYAEPSLGGFSTITTNPEERQSRLDIELLFDAASTCREEIKSILNS